MHRTLRAIVAITALCAAAATTLAAGHADERIAITPGNLIAVLRETPGADKTDEALVPFGTISARAEDGREFRFEASWFQYLGDMHVRLVFDGDRQVQSATPEDLAALHLSPEQALARAVANLRARHGAPVAEPWTGGLMQVHGDAPALDSSYFLDRAFWLEQQRRSPAGLVVAVPERGALVFARADDDAAIATLRFSAAALFASGEATRISSGLYLFRDGHWSVFQAPQKLEADESARAPQ